MAVQHISRCIECEKCGFDYLVKEVYDIDTWNLGHYGVTLDNCPKTLVRIEDKGCPRCGNISSKKKRPFLKGVAMANMENLFEAIGKVLTYKGIIYTNKRYNGFWNSLEQLSADLKEIRRSSYDKNKEDC